MKKILAFIICIVLICAMPLAISAEEELPEAVPDTSETTDIFDEITPESILNWCYEHWEEISVAVTTLLALIYQMRRIAAQGKEIRILNNNSIAIAEKSEAAISSSALKVEQLSDEVKTYKDAIASLLEEIRNSDEEKKAYKAILDEVHTHLKTAKRANVELADEVAELLVLANIPNSKKEELYARHLKAVHEIADADIVEVKEDDGLEA